ncbi:MAG: outer membrane lipoprotein carrier protein LolA [Deltaproteobacteria bacterium]|nr:outer membrane lipoprotein carrier protein LolA [Deltaproteobacteria bacterium]
MHCKLSRFSLLLVVTLVPSAVLGALAPTSLGAQEPRNARDVAALVQSFYDQTTSFQADFFQTRYTKAYNRYDRARGRVTLVKPGKMRWDYTDPAGQTFVSDGSHLSVYQPPDEGEAHGQIIERDVTSDELPQAFAFLLGDGRLDSDFHVRLLDSGRQGFPEGYVLEVRPRRPSRTYDRVLFFVRIPAGAPAGVIHRVLIIDAAGNRNRFDFSHLRFNHAVPDSTFHFTPPAGTRVVRP